MMKNKTSLTPYPGSEVALKGKKQLIDLFKKKFRDPVSKGKAINIPTACLLSGKRGWAVFNSAFFLEDCRIFVLIEGEPLELRESTTKELILFLQHKKPWEDYDICTFDDSLKWCVGISHNDEVIVVDDDDVLAMSVSD